jgi:hypothetical protein
MICRIARHTNDLEIIKIFYVDVLGLSFLGNFENHEGYDGIFIGNTDSDWHLEFTKSNEKTIRKFDEDDLLVFYPKTKLEYDSLTNKLLNNRVQTVIAKNNYWNNNGKMYLDPDGFRIVISPLKLND